MAELFQRVLAEEVDQGVAVVAGYKDMQESVIIGLLLIIIQNP
jgi:hypothetical protein